MDKWVQCLQGEFFSTELQQWINCNGSCIDKWEYQESWIGCGSSEYLDLDTMECVAQWDSATQISINDTQTGNRPVWRSFNYYVNPESDRVVEFGNKKYPYKSLGFVFAELLNFHSNSDRNITVYVLENTTNYLNLQNQYIVNITQVKITTYSLSSNLSAGKAKLVGLHYAPLEFTPGTSLNLLINLDLKLDEKLITDSLITESEK
jgi:hypothetical protein